MCQSLFFQCLRSTRLRQPLYDTSDSIMLLPEVFYMYGSSHIMKVVNTNTVKLKHLQKIPGILDWSCLQMYKKWLDVVLSSLV